ncbi:hypothetical protein QFZ22_000361 [Streptomyces canus]|uniref:Type I-E CRISPR-associated protein Cas6/Cse3/CasE n=1 Tax=Streptomyces canus TaxID=58343 RepID=A0AAW8F560_9ACTN|nr:type I-E CRISPR-associated protein Cas6/Cse3/CasE [Streptomyces canus]MDQ0904376.1 hypothetical protein [Streptomyces canus]
MSGLTDKASALTPGLPVRYRITAAPVRHIPGPCYGRRPDGTLLRRRGTPAALHGPDAVIWWQRRAAAAGLAVNAATLTPHPFPRSPRSADPRGLYHHLSQIDGHAHITDPRLLVEAVCRGIGRAQSYGAGLLSLAPA